MLSIFSKDLFYGTRDVGQCRGFAVKRGTGMLAG